MWISEELFKRYTETSNELLHLSAHFFKTSFLENNLAKSASNMHFNDRLGFRFAWCKTKT